MSLWQIFGWGNTTQEKTNAPVINTVEQTTQNNIDLCNYDSDPGEDCENRDRSDSSITISDDYIPYPIEDTTFYEIRKMLEYHIDEKIKTNKAIVALNLYHDMHTVKTKLTFITSDTKSEGLKTLLRNESNNTHSPKKKRTRKQIKNGL